MPNLKNKTKFIGSSISKNSGWLEKYGDGGDFNDYKRPGPVEDRSTGMTGMMKSKIATEAHYGNPSALRMVSPNPNKYTWTGEELDFNGNQASPAGYTGTHYMSSYGNQARPGLQEVNGKMQYFENPQYNSKENFNFSRPEDAEYFANYYKEVAPMMRNYQNGGWLDTYEDGGETDPPFLEIKKPIIAEAESTGVAKPNITNINLNEKKLDYSRENLNYMHALQLLKKHNVTVDSSGNILKDIGLPSSAYYNPITRTINYNPTEENKRDYKFSLKKEYTDMIMKELPHAIQSDSLGTLKFLKNTIKEGISDVITNKLEKTGLNRYDENDKIEGHAHNVLEQKLIKERNKALGYDKFNYNLMSSTTKKEMGGWLDTYAGGGEIDPPGGLKNNQWMGANLNKEGYITSETKGGNRISFTGYQNADDLFNKQIDSGKFGFDPKNPGVTFLLKKPVKGLSKEDQFMATKEYDDLSAIKGFTNEYQKQQIAKLPKFQQDIINAENEKRRKKVVSDSMQEVGKHPLFYAPGIIGAAPFAVAGLSEAGMASAPYIQGALSTQLPGMANVSGATFGNAITAGFAGHGAAHITPDAIEMYKNPSWSNAGSIAMDVAEISPLIRPLIGPTSKVIGKGLNAAGKYLTEETALKNAWKLNSKAFKENPKDYYRGIGEKGLKNAQETKLK